MRTSGESIFRVSTGIVVVLADLKLGGKVTLKMWDVDLGRVIIADSVAASFVATACMAAGIQQFVIQIFCARSLAFGSDKSCLGTCAADSSWLMGPLADSSRLGTSAADAKVAEVRLTVE